MLRGNQNHSRPHGTVHFISCQEAERRQRPAACLFGQCGNSNDVPAGDTGRVRENCWERGPVPIGRSASERLRVLEQLKTDGLINDEEYNTKRKEILEEL